MNLRPHVARLRFASARQIRLPRWAAVGALFLAMPNPLLAATNELVPVHLEAPSLVFSVFRLVGALALVVALFLGGVWLLRSWQRLTVQRGRAPKLSVLEVRSLGPRHALYVVGYEQQRFLLSSAPTGISLLAPLPAAAETTLEAPTPAPLSFAESLAKVLAPKTGKAGGRL